MNKNTEQTRQCPRGVETTERMRGLSCLERSGKDGNVKTWKYKKLNSELFRIEGLSGEKARNAKPSRCVKNHRKRVIRCGTVYIDVELGQSISS